MEALAASGAMPPHQVSTVLRAPNHRSPPHPEQVELVGWEPVTFPLSMEALAMMGRAEVAAEVVAVVVAMASLLNQPAKPVETAAPVAMASSLAGVVAAVVVAMVAPVLSFHLGHLPTTR